MVRKRVKARKKSKSSPLSKLESQVELLTEEKEELETETENLKESNKDLKSKIREKSKEIKSLRAKLISAEKKVATAGKPGSRAKVTPEALEKFEETRKALHRQLVSALIEMEKLSIDA